MSFVLTRLWQKQLKNSLREGYHNDCILWSHHLTIVNFIFAVLLMGPTILRRIRYLADTIKLKKILGSKYHTFDECSIHAAIWGYIVLFHAIYQYFWKITLKYYTWELFLKEVMRYNAVFAQQINFRYSSTFLLQLQYFLL